MMQFWRYNSYILSNYISRVEPTVAEKGRALEDGEEVSSVAFLKIEISGLIFCEKCLLCFHLRVNFEENLQNFSVQVFLSCVLDEIFIEVPLIQETFSFLKIS